MSSSNVLSRRSFLSRGASGAALLCLPASLFRDYEARADEDNNPVVLRFSALSDVHFKVSPQAQEVDRFRRAIKFMYDYSAKQSYNKFDAMLIAGDVSDHGWDDELLLFKKIMDEGVKPGTTTILCMGNHEFIGGTKPRWEEIFERDSNKTYDVNGFKFIALSPEKGTNRTGDFQYAMDWYKSELEKATAADPGKPIFTFQHYHVTPTVYGSRGEDNWGIADLYDVLQRYPRVINFSGHSHYPINDPRSAWQGNFTAFGTGTLSYFEMGGEGGKFNKFPPGYTKAAQLYVVEVRKDNSVALKPYDLISNTFFDVVYYIAEPGAISKYLYTDARYVTSSKPEWSADAKVEKVEAVDEETVRLTFKQASCKDIVHSYRVELTKKVTEDGKTRWEGAGARYFWSEYYFQPQPDKMNVVLEDLDAATDYRARVVALSPFFKESDDALETEFTTPQEAVSNVDKNAPRPTPNFLDVKFENGKVVNEPVGYIGEIPAVQDFGAPKIADGVANFNGRDQFYKVQFSDREYRRIRKQGTFAVKFQFDAFPEKIADPFANTQGAGVSFELNGQEKTLQMWISINGKYEILSVPIEPSRDFYDAFGTYDGQDAVFYLNGKEVARSHKPGRITHPTNPSEQAFCIGSDIGGGGCGDNYFAGKIERARIFTWALKAEQIANLHKGAESIYDFTVKTYKGEDKKLSDYRGKVLLIVNTATACGFTPQYAPIEQIYRDYHAQGLEVLDFPCNQFGGQAPGADEEIHEFCEANFNTTFQQMKKIDVNGPNELPLYTYLKAQQGFKGLDQHQYKDLLEKMFAKNDPEWDKKSDIKWNFTKFLVDRNGNVVARFEPTADMAVVEKAVKALIEKKAD